MKTIIALIITLATLSSVSASNCGTPVSYGSYPSVPLASFGLNSWGYAKQGVAPTFTFTCTQEAEKRGGNTVTPQKFPSVPLASFGIDSWKVAR